MVKELLQAGELICSSLANDLRALTLSFHCCKESPLVCMATQIPVVELNSTKYHAVKVQDGTSSPAQSSSGTFDHQTSCALLVLSS
jgi:hypothetical protein